VLSATFRLLDGDATRRSGITDFDFSGAFLGSAGMLLLIFGLVRAPDDGWSAARTSGGFAGAGARLPLLMWTEARTAKPLVPLSIFRVKGLAASDATQVIGI